MFLASGIIDTCSRLKEIFMHIGINITAVDSNKLQRPHISHASRYWYLCLKNCLFLSQII
jgi:hypothetical protein